MRWTNILHSVKSGTYYKTLNIELNDVSWDQLYTLGNANDQLSFIKGTYCQNQAHQTKSTVENKSTHWEEGMLAMEEI